MKPYIQRPFYYGHCSLIYFVNRVPHKARTRDPNSIPTLRLQHILKEAADVQNPDEYEKAWVHVCRKELTARLIGAHVEDKFLDARQARQWTRLQDAVNTNKPLRELRYAYPR